MKGVREARSHPSIAESTVHPSPPSSAKNRARRRRRSARTVAHQRRTPKSKPLMHEFLRQRALCVAGTRVNVEEGYLPRLMKRSRSTTAGADTRRCCTAPTRNPDNSGCRAPQMARPGACGHRARGGTLHLGSREYTGKVGGSPMEGAPPGLQGRGAGAMVAERHGWAEGEEVTRPRYMASSPRDPR